VELKTKPKRPALVKSEARSAVALQEKPKRAKGAKVVTLASARQAPVKKVPPARDLAPGKAQPAALLMAARAAARHAYAPYSRFAVGAAVETSDGQTFVGANMENASYGLTMCAEVGALQAASTAGLLGKIRRIAVVGGPMEPQAGYRPKPTAPCGRCRQLIAEAATLGGYQINK
jgi:cytidine deaminase